MPLRVLCASLCTGLAPVLRAVTYFTYNNFCDLLLLTCWVAGVCHNGSHLNVFTTACWPFNACCLAWDRHSPLKQFTFVTLMGRIFMLLLFPLLLCPPPPSPLPPPPLSLASSYPPPPPFLTPLFLSSSSPSSPLPICPLPSSSSFPVES